MAINLIGFIPGVGPTAAFTPGPSTPAPWNVNHTGATDGTGPSTATRNMAEIYNRFFLQQAAVIQQSGLAIDNDNWAQLAAAIQKIANDAASAVAVPQATVVGLFRNLKSSATGLSANVSTSADEIVLKSAGNAYITRRAFASVVNCSANGKNGLSTAPGVPLAINQWYAVYAGFDGAADCGWIDPSPTAPTVPAGVTHLARVGWIRTDATANKYPLSFIQYGDIVKYKPAAGSNLTILPAAATGVAGTFGGAPAAVAWSAFAPSTAVQLGVHMYSGPGVAIQVTSSTVSGTAGYQGLFTAVPSPGTAAQLSDIPIESSNIYYAASGAAATLYVSGWRDNL
jgi:hypothetical protein